MSQRFSYDGPTLTLVVNPTAGRGRAARKLPQVCSRLLTSRPDVHLRVHQTTSYEEARLRCVQAVDHARPDDLLAVMGGDGMAHLGLNACATTGVPLAVIPAGTGNDFCAGAGLPTSVDAAVAAIAAGDVRRVDLAEVSGRLVAGAERRYVGCVVSTGYDARVNVRTNAMPSRLGSLAYAWAALAELAFFEPKHYRISVDGNTRELPAMLVAVANGGVFGGGMRIAPTARVDDGLLDVTIIHPVSRATLLRLLPQMFTGGFVRDPAVERLTAREVVVDGTDLLGMADGERLGDVPLRVRCRSQVLSVVG